MGPRDDDSPSAISGLMSRSTLGPVDRLAYLLSGSARTMTASLHSPQMARDPCTPPLDSSSPRPRHPPKDFAVSRCGTHPLFAALLQRQSPRPPCHHCCVSATNTPSMVDVGLPWATRQRPPPQSPRSPPPGGGTPRVVVAISPPRRAAAPKLCARRSGRNCAGRSARSPARPCPGPPAAISTGNAFRPELEATITVPSALSRSARPIPRPCLPRVSMRVERSRPGAA